ncbi:hypothetical protein P153DRAFT_324132 [Dothidotthia symphoricarpi CBS 119687]|uniref:Uncharacterized protein n=1 Tax=Dothidotthia symphoricarpi CBS 119687 TaxID=1392245 RepID=A0A6A6A3T8_9PLEO|nr:uncharacterized protein P153DRAFT_324132 [Dothidotthia symphoricarpi CBS 119687]KAF2125845.1 hypothetical protein P153DRAFT_324132 [Dothidotthia symphoricarpi CBS 119687]
MFHSYAQGLVDLPQKSASSDGAQLPRGECGFIAPEPEAGHGSRQRCACRSFYPDPVVRSRCGCGHQAWHHEAQPVSTVSVEEYIRVVEQMKQLKHEVRRYESLEQELKQELLRERMAREEHFRTYKALEARMYGNMQLLKISMDDRVEAVVDRTTEFSNQIKAVQERLTMVDEVTMELENRIDRVEHSSGPSRNVTPVASPPRARLSTPRAPPTPQLPLLMQPPSTLGQLPIRTDKKYPLSWNVRIIFVPQKSQRYAFNPDSTGYKRCASRKLHQNLDFPDQDSACFSHRIEAMFKDVIRGRPWMPMTGHRPTDEPFGRMTLTLLPPDLIHRDLWNYPFLEDHCIAHDKMQGDILYIALQYEDVTWHEIRLLPPANGFDESCWNPDDELDGMAKYKSLDSEIMALSKLDVLADSAAMLSPIERAQTQSSNRSMMRTPIDRILERVPTQSSSHSSSSRFSLERSSLRSFETDITDDEHRDKKPKLRAKQSMPSVNASGHAQQPMYVSGRSKRKMPMREKGPKEPLHFNVTNVTKWRPTVNLLHPHSSKGKEVAHNQ